MGRSRETMGKREVRIKKEKKRQDKEKKKQGKGEGRDGNNLNDMIAYVDEYGNITSTPPDPTVMKKIINVEDIRISIPKNLEVEPESPFREGIVSFFNNSKGFGFIKDSETKEDVFVHINGLLEPIKENNKVSFEVTRNHKGANAINVKVVRE